MVAQPPIAGGCPLARARAALRREREAVPLSALARPARSEGAAQWQASTRYAAPSADLLRAACAGYVPARGGGGVAHGDGVNSLPLQYDSTQSRERCSPNSEPLNAVRTGISGTLRWVALVELASLEKKQ